VWYVVGKTRSEHTINVTKGRLGGGSGASRVSLRAAPPPRSPPPCGAHGAQTDQLLLNCRNHAARPIGYITDTPRHTFTAATRSTRHAYAPRTAQNAPRLEPDHTPESRQYRPLGGSTRQPTTALIRAGRGGDSITASLHTRAKFALWDSRGGASRRHRDPTRGRRPLADVHGLRSGARVRSLVRLDPGPPRPVTCGTRESTTAAR
jgi:hypothetical protein